MLFTGRTIKIISGDLKSRIDTCQKDCASLKDRFNSRLLIDTNIQMKETSIQVKEIKIDMGIFFSFFYAFL